MNQQNKRPSLRTMATGTSNTKTNAANSNSIHDARKRLIRLANRIKIDAYDLVDSRQIVANFINEIEEMRSKTNSEGHL